MAKQATRRVRTDTVGTTARRTVSTPVVAFDRGGADAAFALADILKGAQPLAEREEQETAARAAADVQTGNVDPDDPSRIYRNNVNRLQARADWVRDEAQFDESLLGLDLDSISETDLNAHIDRLYAEKYEGLDDPVVIEELMPRMESYRAKVLGDVLKRQADAERENNDANLTAVAEGAYTAASEEGVEFDYQGMNEQIAAVYPGRRSEINSVYFELLKDLAIRNGDPDLLRNVPATWENGAPSFVSIPDFNEKVLNAEQRAQAVADARTSAEEDALEAARDEHLNVLATAAVKAASEGDFGSAQRFLDVYAATDGVEAKDVLAFEKGIHTLTSNFNVQGAQPEALVELSAQVYAGNSSIGDIWAAFDRGVFGYGPQAVNELQQLMNTVRTIASSDTQRLASREDYKTYLRDIREAYDPSPTDLKFDPTMGELQRLAQLEYFEMTHNQGMAPSEAHAEIREKFDPRAARQLSLEGRSRALEPDEAAIELANGAITTFRAREAGVTADVIYGMVDSGRLTDRQAKKILAQLLSIYQ